MKKYYPIFMLFLLAFACATPAKKSENKELSDQIAKNEYIPFVKTKALEIMKTGFNAGDGYREV